MSEIYYENDWEKYKEDVRRRRKEAEDYIGYGFEWEDDEAFEEWEMNTDIWVECNGGHIQDIFDEMRPSAKQRYYNRIKPFVLKIENYYLNAKYNPRTPIGEKFANALYNENFSSS